MKKVLLVISLVFLSSCVSAPKSHKDDLDITIPKERLIDINISDTWWKEFGDEKLNSIIELVLTHNYNLKIAAANVEATLAQAQIAGSDIFPSISATSTRTRMKQNYIGLPFPGFENQVLSSIVTSYGASIDLSWELDLWGRIRAQKSASLANLEASKADLAGVKLSLIAQTIKAWFAAVEVQYQLKLAKKILNNHEEILKWTENRYKRGRSTSDQVRIQKTNLASAKIILNQWKEQNDRLIRQLEILMGKYPQGKLTVSETIGKVNKNIPDGLPADLISRRPDLVSAERNLAALDKLVWQAKTNLYPRFSLTASGGRSSSEFDDLMDGDFGVWNAISSFLQPIFQGGKLRAAVKKAKALKTQALANFANTALNAYSEVELALLSDNYMDINEDQTSIIYEQSKALYKSAQSRYQNGSINLLTLLEAEKNMLQAQSKLITIRRQQIDVRVNLYLALGGGFNKENIK